MIEDIYSWDDNLTENEYYEGLLFVLGDVYPDLSEEEIEDMMEDMLDRVPDRYAESFLSTIGNVGKNLGSGALNFAADNPDLIRTGATIAGAAYGGPIGAQIGGMAGNLITKQLGAKQPQQMAQMTQMTQVAQQPQIPQQPQLMPETGKALAMMQNPQAQTALARATIGVGGGTAPLVTNSGNTTMVPVATYLRAIMTSLQNSLKELDANNVIPAPALSESLPYAEDIDMQAEWLAEELSR